MLNVKLTFVKLKVQLERRKLSVNFCQINRIHGEEGEEDAEHPLVDILMIIPLRPLS